MATIYSSQPHPPPNHPPYSLPPSQPSEPFPSSNIAQAPPIVAGPVRGISYPPQLFADPQPRPNPNLVGPSPYEPHFDSQLGPIPAGQPVPQNPNLMPIYLNQSTNVTPPNGNPMYQSPSQDTPRVHHGEMVPVRHRRSYSEGYTPSYVGPPPHLSRVEELQYQGGHSQHRSEDGHHHRHRHHSKDPHKTHGGDTGTERPTLGDSLYMTYDLVKRVLGGKKKH